MNGFSKWWTASCLGLSACWGSDFLPDKPPLRQSGTEYDRNMDTLDLQREKGWHVGTDNTYLSLPTAQPIDVDGTDAWRTLAASLPTVLAPKRAELSPFYVPTLFQALTEPSADDLRAAVEPMLTNEMESTNDRARAVEALLDDAGWPRDLAIIVDLPGPQSVALAARLADRADPVFAFGNWPHPRGVVPAHETLAASLYYAPLFERTRATRPADAPPLFVLDSNRLAPYSDEYDEFDNRYTARLPTTAALQRLGIRHVLYINADGAEELDDLNEAFVDLQQNGIDVRMMALEDIMRSEIAPTDADAPEVAHPYWVQLGYAWLYWGGSAHSHHCFWNRMSWPYGHHDPFSLEMRNLPLAGEPLPTTAMLWRPIMRGTIFQPGQVGTAALTQTARRPFGFGSATARMTRSNGRVVAMLGGRSGSFGRSGGFHAG